jgi:hypothetical protein
LGLVPRPTTSRRTASILHSTPIAAMAAVIVTWVCAFALPRDFTVGNYVDDAHYAVLAKALRERGEYRTINLPGEPPETKYPPGYPMLLALVWSPSATAAQNLERLRWVNLVLVGPLAGSLTVLGASLIGLSPPLAATLTVAGLLSPRTAATWTVPLSGPLFLLLLTTGLLWWASGRRLKGMTLMIASVYVRTIGIGFVVAALAASLRSRDRTWRDQVLLVLVGMAPWLLWEFVQRNAVPNALLGLYGSYSRWYLLSLTADPLTVLFRVPFINLKELLYEMGADLIGRGWLPWIHTVVCIGIGMGVGWGVWLGRKAGGVVATGLALYGLSILLWPFPPDRFLSGVWPVALLVLAAAMGARARWLAVATVAIAVVGLVRGDPVRGHRGRAESADEITAMVRRDVNPNDVVASTNAPLHYLQLGVPTVPGQRMVSYRRYRLGFWSTAWGLGDDLWSIVDQYKVTKLVVEARGVEGRYAAGSLESQCPGVLTNVWETPDGGLLFNVNADVACDPRVVRP